MAPPPVLLDGRAVANTIHHQITQDCHQLRARAIQPGLAVIRVGNDPASKVYVQRKIKLCAQVGIHSQEHVLPEAVTATALSKLIDDLNQDNAVSGILLQLPLPSTLVAHRFIDLIDPAKDVDGLSAHSAGMLQLGQPGFVPCTPKGVMALLSAYDLDCAGHEVVIIGRSNLVGKPLAALITLAGGTVTLCHSQTRNLAAHCLRADLLIVAAGRPGLVSADWIKPGAIVIDVGINRLDSGQLVGDVDFASASTKAGWITPVPGGVGPMTVAMLMTNTLLAAEQHATSTKAD